MSEIRKCRRCGTVIQGTARYCENCDWKAGGGQDNFHKPTCELCKETATLMRDGHRSCDYHWNFGEWQNKMKKQIKATGHWKLENESVGEWQQRCKQEFFAGGLEKLTEHLTGG